MYGLFYIDIAFAYIIKYLLVTLYMHLTTSCMYKGPRILVLPRASKNSGLTLISLRQVEGGAAVARWRRVLLCMVVIFSLWCWLHFSVLYWRRVTLGGFSVTTRVWMCGGCCEKASVLLRLSCEVNSDRPELCSLRRWPNSIGLSCWVVLSSARVDVSI